jgi:metal-responsive CopG/Arc/MetJ family transcriptional regulator
MTDEELRAVSVVLPPGLAGDALRAANDAGISRSELVRRLLTDYLSRNGDDQ